MESAFGQQKKKNKRQDLDIQLADELASGLRSSSSSHEHFLRAVGESRLISKKEQESKLKKEDNEFVKKTLKDHEKKVKIELKAIMQSKRNALLETIFGKKERAKEKKEKFEEGEDRKEEQEKREKKDD
jgi:hypothetical protein